MKRYLSAFLCVCVLCGLSAAAFASDVIQYTDDDWKALYGIPEPRYDDFEDSGEYAVAWDAWFEGYISFIFSTTQAQEEASRLAAEEAARQAAEEQVSPAPSETTSTKPIESAGSNNGNSSQALDNGAPDKYPLGSYVDPAGVVWSPDGTRLSPDISPDAASSQYVDPEVAEITIELLYELLSDVASDTDALASDKSAAYLIDLRPADPPVTVLDGLKALVTSIFGEYTPVTTNTVVTQTVGNDTYEYLVETVAPGAAGVDYEWVAGVFLFGIMLFCLMKLLGGVLK